MDLQTVAHDMEMEEKAKKFSELVWERRFSEALKFYGEADADVQSYIMRHKQYSFDLKAAHFGRI